MSEIKKIVLKADSYPNKGVRAVPLAQGDMFYTTDIKIDAKVGDYYKDYPAIISHIDYKPRKWYQFWKKKEPIAACIIWLGNE